VEVTYPEAVAVSVDKPGKQQHHGPMRWSDKAYDSLAGSLDEVDTDMHIGLPSGIAVEDIALHHGAELDMLMDELNRVDVTEPGAEPGPLILEAEHFSEEDAIDEIAVHVIVNLTFIVSEEFI
jgi:hypothetical protein